MLLLLAMAAHADVVQPFLGSCPPGALGVTSHSSQHCAPLVCPAEGECRDGRVCETNKLCIVEGEQPCGGRSRADCTVPFVGALGVCETDSDCDKGACIEAKRCIRPPPAPAESPPGSTSGSWGCSTLGTAPAVAVLLGLLPLAFRKREDG